MKQIVNKILYISYISIHTKQLLCTYVILGAMPILNIFIFTAACMNECTLVNRKGYNGNDKNIIKLIYKNNSSENIYIRQLLIRFDRADGLSSLGSIVPDT